MKHWLFLGIIGFLFQSVPALAQTPLALDAPGDTLRLCQNRSLTLRYDISGGQAPYQLTWRTLRFPAQPSVGFPTQPAALDSLELRMVAADTATVELSVVDNTGSLVKDTVVLIGYGDCVWPGDADGDGFSRHLDILALGLTSGWHGPARPDAHLNWSGQPATPWGHVHQNGVDFVHADTDGDGFVSAADTLAISRNYNFLAASPGQVAPNAPSLSLATPADTLQPGDTVRIPIRISGIDSLYGIAFSLRYNAGLVKSVQLDLQNSSLGSLGQDLWGFAKNFPAQGQIDIAITRSDQIQRLINSGVGSLVITIDDIGGKNEAPQELIWEASEVILIRADGSSRLASSQSHRAWIWENDQPPRFAPPEPIQMQIFPNPAVDRIFIQPGSEPILSTELIDLNGRRIFYLNQPLTTRRVISTQNLSAGFYTLRITTQQQRKYYRIEIH